MKLIYPGLHGLVLTIINITGVLVGFGAYHLLKPANQIAIQVPVAATVCIIGFVSWNAFSQRLPFKGLAKPRGGELLWVYLAALLWNPVLFVPLHYLTQGYLTSFGNILGLWLFQIPVNLLAILAAQKLGRPWLMVLLFLAACPTPALSASVSPPELRVTAPDRRFGVEQVDGPRTHWPQPQVYNG